MSVAAAVLAAGRGARVADDRLGRVPKPLVEALGRPLVSWALDAAMASGLRPVFVVVGAHAKHVAAAAPQGVVVVRARGARSGLAGSLRAALTAVEGWVQASALCIGSGEQPAVGEEAYRRLAAAHEEGAELAVATFGGRRGGPVLVARTLWAEACRLRREAGLEALIERHAVVEVDCSGTGSPLEVDMPEDLRAVEAELRRQ